MWPDAPTASCCCPDVLMTLMRYIKRTNASRSNTWLARWVEWGRERDQSDDCCARESPALVDRANTWVWLAEVPPYRSKAWRIFCRSVGFNEAQDPVTAEEEAVEAEEAEEKAELEAGGGGGGATLEKKSGSNMLLYMFGAAAAAAAAEAITGGRCC